MSERLGRNVACIRNSVAELSRGEDAIALKTRNVCRLSVAWPVKPLTSGPKDSSKNSHRRESKDKPVEDSLYPQWRQREDENGREGQFHCEVAAKREIG